MDLLADMCQSLRETRANTGWTEDQCARLLGVRTDVYRRIEAGNPPEHLRWDSIQYLGHRLGELWITDVYFPLFDRDSEAGRLRELIGIAKGVLDRA